MQIKDIENLVAEARRDISSCQSHNDLLAAKGRWIGPKSRLKEAMTQLRSLPPQERPIVGRALQQAMKSLQQLLRDSQPRPQETAAHVTSVDLTLPLVAAARGTLHPISETINRLVSFFVDLGYEVVEGSEVEDDWHNFTALRLPPNHPARTMQDTFYVESDAHGDDALVLRTQTSSSQIRRLRGSAQDPHAGKAPVYMVSPGVVFRRGDYDASHTPQFHQIEVMAIDRHITMKDLRATLEAMLAFFFGRDDVRTRLRPSYFPFTQPSAEVDLQCVRCEGKGCQTCSQSGWLEVLGCGMVHPDILREQGVDTREFQGFAFGMGVERLAALRYGIPDIRAFYHNERSFLSQFGGRR